MARPKKIDGLNDIRDGTIKDINIAEDALIAESKLNLAYTTTNLNTRAVLIDTDRTIGENVYVTFPSTGFKMKDSVNGKTYLITLENGVLKAQEL